MKESKDEIIEKLARELNVRLSQIQAAVKLLDEGATVPFIARYRKEATGELDDGQLRSLEERLRYLREMAERTEAILKSIAEQDKLTPELESGIRAADSKQELEDLYLPFKPRRRTKAQTAREAGLEPLADSILLNTKINPEQAAAKYVDSTKGVADPEAALEGARHILIEKFAEDATLLGRLRKFLNTEGQLSVTVKKGKEQEAEKFSDYFDYNEPLKRVVSHRALAIFRAEAEGYLKVGLEVDGAKDTTHPCEQIIASSRRITNGAGPRDSFLMETVRQTWRTKLRTQTRTDLLGKLREEAEKQAIQVFADNLKDLLLAAPAGRKRVLALDPGFRTGVKLTALDDTGRLLEHGVIYPHQPRQKWKVALEILEKICEREKIELIALGNGTASRETDALVQELIKNRPDLKLGKMLVSEAGASVYSASETGASEFPDLDVSYRGAVSIGRRLQDPLAELVKIDPKSIGVGQYQHDVNQTELARSLGAVVEDCVNSVGVNVNTASASLLSMVSGLNRQIAGNIVAYRDKTGPFANRKALKKVPRLGEKAYEQAAGFLRIPGGDNPLDASGVHPESYPVVERILSRNKREIGAVIGDVKFLRSLKPGEYTDDTRGPPTVKDILGELEKPGRDPRGEFRTAEFKADVTEITDLAEDMILEGVVSNVADFGAFVDIGVHQDGLVHISQLANTFVKDPRDVVKAGDIVKVRVMEVDAGRKRISLSMKEV